MDGIAPNPTDFNHGTTRKLTEIAPNPTLGLNREIRETYERIAPNPTSQIKTADHADGRRPPPPVTLICVAQYVAREEW